MFRLNHKSYMETGGTKVKPLSLKAVRNRVYVMKTRSNTFWQTERTNTNQTAVGWLKSQVTEYSFL